LVDPDSKLIEKAEKYLQDGYKRLVGYETRSGGFEWFGEDPGHEALTAYGLMQFLEMQKVMPIDNQMIERTKEWLLSRQTKDGSFQLNPKNLDQFGGAPEDITK
jgi:hypothetical protein